MKYFSLKATTVVFLGLVLASCGSDSKSNASDPTADYAKECSSTKSLFETKDEYRANINSIIRRENYENNVLKGSACLKIIIGEKSITTLSYEKDGHGKMTYDKNMDDTIDAFFGDETYAERLYETGSMIQIDKQTFDLNHKNTIFDMTSYNTDNVLDYNLYIVEVQAKKYGYEFTKTEEGDVYGKFDFVEPTATGTEEVSIKDGVISLTVDGALRYKFYLVKRL